MRIQQPLTLPPFDEPEPDGAVVKGKNEDYASHHPSADEVLCVIEVADATLRRDRTTKLRVYATAAIPLYLIINLPERVIEAYRQPRPGRKQYAESEICGIKHSITLPTARGAGLIVPARRLLPQWPRIVS